MRRSDEKQYALHARYWDAAAETFDPETQKEDHSREIRRLLVEDFGFLPASIMPNDRSQDYPDEAAEGKNTLGTVEGSKDQYARQKEAGGRLSSFEGRLAKNCIQLWSDPGDLILDPFAGRGTRLAAALDLGRAYVGFDPSEDAQQAAASRAAGRGGWAIIPESSLYLDRLFPGKAQMVFTCPPYYDSEFYGDNGVGVEAAPTYGVFIDEMACIFAQAARVLDDGGYFVVVIRGFYLGAGYDTPAHFSRVLSGLGLTLHDHIAKNMSTSRLRFHQDVLKWRRTAQVHETVLCFRKAKPKASKQVYRDWTHEKNLTRPLQEDELERRRQEVAQEYALDLGAFAPLGLPE